MTGAIILPAWLQDAWTICVQWIAPILTPILTALVSWLAIKVRSDAKIAATKAELQLEALKNVANREDNKPQLDEQTKQINNATSAITCLAEVMNLAFQNSDLDPEIKLNIQAMLNKLKYGSEEDLVVMLQDANAKLTEQVNELTAKLAASEEESGEEGEIKRQRR